MPIMDYVHQIGTQRQVRMYLRYIKNRHQVRAYASCRRQVRTLVCAKELFVAHINHSRAMVPSSHVPGFWLHYALALAKREGQSMCESRVQYLNSASNNKKSAETSVGAMDRSNQPEPRCCLRDTFRDISSASGAMRNRRRCSSTKNGRGALCFGLDAEQQVDSGGG